MMGLWGSLRSYFALFCYFTSRKGGLESTLIDYIASIYMYEHSQESSVKVSFRLLQELDEWMKMHFRKQLLKGEDSPSSKVLDVLSEVHGHVV